MNLLDTLSTSQAIQTFGWILLHSLWQGIVLAVFLKAALNLPKKVSANTRYLIACLTLVLMLLLPVATALRGNAEKYDVDSRETAFQFTKPNEKLLMPLETPARAEMSEIESSYKLCLRQAETRFFPWLVLLWLMGVLVSSLKLMGVWTYTQWLKQNKENLVLERWRSTLQKLCRQLQVSKTVVLLESSLVKVPTVIGWLKPVILVPSSALTGLTPQQFELILAHELAHIRRYDYLINLFQIIIETVLFYHPAVWWVSTQILNERENACDDLAVSVGGDAVTYADALVAMERLRKVNPSFAMAADGGSLSNRIHRLLGVEMPDSKLFAALWTVIFIGIFMFTVGVIKQNSFAAKEIAADDLLLNLPSKASSESNERIIKESNLQKPEEIQKRKKTIEENTKNLSFDELETNSNAAPEIKQEINSNGYTKREIAEKAPPIESPQQPIAAATAMATAYAEANATANPTIGTLTNTKNEPENKPLNEVRSPDFIDEMASVGFTNLSVGQLVKLRQAGVTADYVRGFRAIGLTNLSREELANLGFARVTPGLVKKLQTIGYGNLSSGQLANFGYFNVTPEFINSMRTAGLNNLSPGELVSLRLSNITAEFARRARDRSGSITVEQIIELKKNGAINKSDE